jgi:hypothetical protein
MIDRVRTTSAAAIRQGVLRHYRRRGRLDLEKSNACLSDIMTVYIGVKVSSSVISASHQIPCKTSSATRRYSV